MVDEPKGLGNLNLNNPFNIGIYVSAIILISSFVITPAEIQLPLLRATCFRILLVSMVLREAAYGILHYAQKNKDNSVLILYYALQAGLILWAILEVSNLS